MRHCAHGLDELDGRGIRACLRVQQRRPTSSTRKGVLVPQAANTISFSISGPGTLVGVDNGNAISHESYKGTTRLAFSGKALAIVRATKTAGKITLQATSGSLTAGSVDITTGSP